MSLSPIDRMAEAIVDTLPAAFMHPIRPHALRPAYPGEAFEALSISGAPRASRLLAECLDIHDVLFARETAPTPPTVDPRAEYHRLIDEAHILSQRDQAIHDPLHHTVAGWWANEGQFHLVILVQVLHRPIIILEHMHAATRTGWTLTQDT